MNESIISTTPLQCHLCNKIHNGQYGSGRFCSSICARTFSRKHAYKDVSKWAGSSKEIRKVISIKKVKLLLKGKSLLFHFHNQPIRLTTSTVNNKIIDKIHKLEQMIEELKKKNISRK